jgi:uncharacterized protein YggE
MKTNILFLIIFLFTFGYANCQDNSEDKSRYIEVTGSAEMEVQPDEIIFTIKYSEYWKEEFEKGKVYADYVTKIPLEDIEKSVLNELTNIGITKEQMILSDATSTTYWVAEGKGFRKSKTISIVLKDFNKVNEIINNVKTKGVIYMAISELKNKNITEYRKQVKIEAMKAAKEKATYLLQSVGENIGRVITAIEIENNNSYLWRQKNSYSNTMLTNNSTTSDNDENIKKIKLKYEIKVRFEIK